MIVAFPEAKSGRSIVQYSLKERPKRDIFGNRMIQKKSGFDQPPKPANVDAEPLIPLAVENPDAKMESAIPMVYLNPEPNIALKRQTASELWSTTALPANDNLKLTAD